MKLSKLIAALILAGMTTMAIAQTNNFPGSGNGVARSGGQSGSAASGEKRPHGPPPQAIDACKNMASGAACSFVGRENKTLSGTCFAPPGGNHPLACRPDRGAPDTGGHG